MKTFKLFKTLNSSPGVCLPDPRPDMHSLLPFRVTNMTRKEKKKTNCINQEGKILGQSEFAKIFLEFLFSETAFFFFRLP